MTISFSDIDTALREEDIEGLIALGTPTDEYSSEAKEIADALQLLHNECPNEEVLVSIISHVWSESFHRSEQELEERKPAFQRVAKKLAA